MDSDDEPEPEPPEEMPPIHKRPTKHGPYRPFDWADNREPPAYWHRPRAEEVLPCRP